MILKIQPTYIYSTQSAPINTLFRTKKYPKYQSSRSKISYRNYFECLLGLPELQNILPLKHIQARELYENGDICQTIIHQYTQFVDQNAKQFEKNDNPLSALPNVLHIHF